MCCYNSHHVFVLLFLASNVPPLFTLELWFSLLKTLGWFKLADSL